MLYRNGSRVLLLLALLLPAALLAQPLSTVTVLGDKQQHFDYKSDVHIQTSGLAAGEYYYQVTNPNGSDLLSKADISLRKVTVLEGGTLGGPPTPQLIPFDTTGNPGRQYKVWLISKTVYDSNGGNFADSSSHTHSFKVLYPNGGVEPEPPPTHIISGMKYFDIDTDGAKDPGEVGVEGIRIVITYPTLDYTTETTDSLGQWSLELEEGTQFTACEVLPSTGGWIQTGPLPDASVPGATANASRCWTGTVGSADIEGLDFGNVCIGAGGGKSKGFWTNNNGQAAMNDNGGPGLELAILSAHNLVSGSGAAFNPTTYAQFKSWLNAATATNMAYMLSAQLAAMELNVEAGWVHPECYLLAGLQPVGCTVPVNVNRFITVEKLMQDADGELTLYPVTVAGTLERRCQEFKKNILDGANNDKGYVQPAPCPVVYPTE